ncbi:4803_t:CDS:2 [Paraglomus brasilianum]|uniref:4803_t:CDS:1 n=1 Tax=Paraglomus brasilianum TaxID=144538 RepID=A0A9N9G9V4_9GLOM|nr:4803_t:CDS:2 [Paraglomus brasilianum]
MDPLIESMLRASLDDEKEPERSDESGNSDTEDSTSNQAETAITVPSQHGGRQTGPKGVLADHAHYMKMERERKAAEISAHNKRMLSKAPTTTTYREDQAKKEADEKLLQELENMSSDDEEEVLRRYREQRLSEIQKAALRKRTGPLFGSLREISASQYVKSIDNEGADVSVIVHLYENEIPECRVLNECLVHLARKYISVKFLRVQAREVEFDLVGLPALLAYKNGLLIANLVKVTDEIGEREFDANVVEEILIRHHALSANEVINTQADDSPDDE